MCFSPPPFRVSGRRPPARQIQAAPISPRGFSTRIINGGGKAEVQAAQGSRVKPPRLDISPDRDSLKVTFEGGESYELSAEMLRVMSPSAEVQGHSPDQRVTVARKRHVKIKELRPVGNYAVRIAFDDGHDTGLYTWTYLMQLGRHKDERWGQYLEELTKKGLSR